MEDLQEREPIPRRGNVLVTRASPSVYNVSYLGKFMGCVCSADVFARHCRRLGYNVIHVGGTDEYGTVTESMEEGCTPQEICDKYHAIHRDVYDWLGISFDEFGHTSTPQRIQICQAIFSKLMEKERLLKDSRKQFYCETTCKRFLAHRRQNLQVKGNLVKPPYYRLHCRL